MTSYIFKVVIEPDEDRWHAYCPALVERGAATWGATRGEALANIEDVVKIVVASMLEHGETIEPADTVEVSREPRIAVTV
jgi:predicted RNase H-like HicB family nuclease